MNCSAIVAGHQIRGAVKSLGWRFALLFAERQRVAAFHQPPLISPEASGEISRAAAKQLRHIDAAIACQVEEAAGDDLVDRKFVTDSRVRGRARRDYPTGKRCPRGRPADSESAVALETNTATAEGPLKSRRIE